MARPTGSCPPGRKPLLSDRETALGRRSFRPSPCRGRHPSSPRRRGGSNIHSYFWPMWLKYSFPLVAQILVPTWLKYSLTFTPTTKRKELKPHEQYNTGYEIPLLYLFGTYFISTTPSTDRYPKHYILLPPIRNRIC